jgi:thioredoxin-like negative regulator of GroEL
LEGSPIVSWLVALLLSGFVGNSDRLIFEFTKDGCGPCIQLQPAIDQLKRDGWSVRTVNTDREPLLVRKYAIQSLPTLVVVEGGREVERIIGAAPYEKISARLAKLDAKVEPPIASQLQAAPTSTPSQSFDQGPTIRGQSQALNAFPMLNSVASAAAVSATPAPRTTEQPPQRAVDNVSKAPENSARLADRNRNNPVVSAVANIPSSPRTSSAIDPQQAILIAQQATVRIRVDEENTTAYGTGTIVDVHGDEALILTCGHLFREMKPHSQLTVDLYSSPSQSTNLPAQLIDFNAADGQPDIGLLSIRLPFAVQPVPVLPKGQRLTVGQAAFSFGCDGQNPTRRDTKVKSINRYLGPANVEIAGAPAVGRSGGGLFDAQGRLIGVCNAAEATGDEGIYASAEVVYAQIDRLGLTHLFESNGTSTFESNERPIQNRPTDSSVQLASNLAGDSEPVESQSAASSIANARSNGIQWPDEKAEAMKTKQLGSASLMCVLRDASGKEQIVNISSPTPELLEVIRQASAPSSLGQQVPPKDNHTTNLWTR